MSPPDTKYETGKKTGLRGKPGRLVGIAVIVAVVAGALAFVLTMSSSAQTASKASDSSSSSTDSTSSLTGTQPSTQQMSPVEAMTRSSFGNILVTDSGATLYRYTPDKPNTPTCTGSCAVAWPPDLLPAGTKSVPAGGLAGLSSVMLPDGRRQLTYNRTPLYTFADDSGTSVNGQGIGGVWFVVHPATTAGKTTGTSATPAASTSSASHSSSGGGYGY